MIPHDYFLDSYYNRVVSVLCCILCCVSCCLSC